MSWVKLFLLLKLKSFRAQLQYPASFFTQIFSVSLIGLLRIPSLLLLTYAFPSIGGWDFWQLAFMASIYFMAHGVHHGLFFAFFNHRSMVWRGEFDLILVRPLSPVLQIMASSLNLSAIGEFIPGIVLLLLSASKVKVAWSPFNISYLIMVVVAGAVIEWAVNLIFMTFDFWLERTTLLWIPDVFMRWASVYPIHIYGSILSVILTFVFPYAFIAYFPAQYFFQRYDVLFGQAYVYMTPLVALFAISVALLFWFQGLKRYQSTGA
jgi:ABC-2 type transport system permease protein